MFRLLAFFWLVSWCSGAVLAAENVVVVSDARLSIDRPTKVKELVVLDRGRVSIDDLFAADLISLGTGYGNDAIVARDSRRGRGEEGPFFYRWDPFIFSAGYIFETSTFETGTYYNEVGVISASSVVNYNGYLSGGSFSSWAGSLTISVASNLGGTLSINKFPRDRQPYAVVSAPTVARRVMVAGKSHLQVDDLLVTPLLGLLEQGSVSVRGELVAQYLLATSKSHLDVSGRLWAHSLNFTDRSTAYISGQVVSDRATLYGDAVLDVNRRLKVNDDLLLAGGILTGSGKVVGDVRNKNGIVAPGDGIGRLRVDGDFRQYSNEFSDGGSGGYSPSKVNNSPSSTSPTLQIGIASRSKYDRLIVDGKARIGGRIDIELVDGFVPEVGDRFKIIETSEGIRGRVDNEVTLLGHPVSFTRSGGDLYLEVEEKPRFDEDNTFTQFTRTSNQREVATAIRDYLRSHRNTAEFARLLRPLLNGGLFDLSGSYISVGQRLLPSVVFSSSSLVVDGGYVRMREPKAARIGIEAFQRNVLDAITPYNTFSLAETALSLGNTQISQLENNLISQASSMALETPVSAGVPMVSTVVEDGPKWSSFVEGSGIFARIPDVGNVAEFDYQTAAATVGGSYKVSERLRLGIYGGYAATNADLAGGSELFLNSGRFGVFGVWSPLDRAYFYGSLGGAVHAFEYERKIVFPGLNRTAKSDPTGIELDTLVGGGYDFQVGNLSFGPVGSLQYTYLDIGEFTERNAGALSLRYRRQREDSLRSTLGGRAAYNISVSSSISIEPSVRVAWQHEYLDDPSLSASFNRGASPYFDLTSPSGARDTLLVSAGASINFGDRFGASAFYSNSKAFDSGYVHAVQAGFRYSW